MRTSTHCSAATLDWNGVPMIDRTDDDGTWMAKVVEAIRRVVCCLSLSFSPHAVAKFERLTSQSRMDLIDYLHIALRQKRHRCWKIWAHWVPKHIHFLFVSTAASECRCHYRVAAIAVAASKTDWLVCVCVVGASVSVPCVRPIELCQQPVCTKLLLLLPLQ